MSQVYAIFHLNLAFSAIATEDRGRVIDACYAPLLDLIESRGLPLGVEASAWTLEQVQALRPQWMDRFRGLLERSRCELVGSGYIQAIGPLMPHAVNHWNQEWGLRRYRSLLGVRPRIVLVNEMAFSPAMVDIYADHGYEALVLDWDNAHLLLGDALPRQAPWLARGLDRPSLPVLWSDSILFQKFQRFVHRDIDSTEYHAYLARRFATASHPLPLYCSDVEIFGFRPRRYDYEPLSAAPDEWQRIGSLFDEVLSRHGVTWLLPSKALTRMVPNQDEPEPAPLGLNAVDQPIPVKKQPKYNVSRWAVTGRADLRLNSLCHRAAELIENAAEVARPEFYRRLCLLWSSDLRTHIHPDRLQRALHDLQTLIRELGGDPTFPIAVSSEPGRRLSDPALSELGVTLERDPEGIELRIRTDHLDVALNLRRGLAIKRLAFPRHDAAPLIGTLAHGYFEGIDLGADFYSGHVVMELPADHRRLTDLARCEPEWYLEGETGDLVVQGRIGTHLGPILKQYRFRADSESLAITYAFPGWLLPRGTARVGHFTLLPHAFRGPLQLRCHNGGRSVEIFPLDRACHHGSPLSSLVSCTTGFGATEGWLEFGDARRRLRISWDPGRCAVFPMLWHDPRPPGHLTRVLFSLAEWDETRRESDDMASVSFALHPVG
ncbi:Glyco-hydro-57 domain-containing protein [Sulfidibacter corallicola]|uniref:Glycoside hydrolase family 57 N-terminal domain-containing protein n=1 Tax=Sulfidibacter corallicola TaxID=2818388 RepID=A0A8A4U4H9_SULCO|nr:hypothetical protein [Sulfidibacter corallicola]QTD53655.1 hypothetical protein J3U87_14470 [Sulfidibacter corallicola]